MRIGQTQIPVLRHSGENVLPEEASPGLAEDQSAEMKRDPRARVPE